MTRWTIALAIAASVVAACGGSNERPDEAPTVEAPPPPDCVPLRWERPPEDIGQTPPDRPAPDDALVPFDGSGRGVPDGSGTGAD